MTRKEFDKKFKSVTNLIDKRIKKVVKDRKPLSLYEPFDYLLSAGGKRLRPFLVDLSCKACGGKFQDSINAAIGVELLHNFTLVHDDIMDNADKRRGHLTIHKKYDVNTAILVGDSMLAVAYEFMLNDLKDEYAKSVSKTFTQGLIEVCEGQSLDKEFETRKKVSIYEYLIMIRKKTAEMLSMCCSIGAQIGNGTKEEIKALSNYGLNIGIAFQIQDDLLDVIGDESQFGKSIGGDLIEGKKTYLFLKAVEKGGKKYSDLFRNFIINKGIKRNKIKDFTSVYYELGVLDDAKEEIKNYTRKAISGLKVLRNKKYITQFEHLADYLLNRSK